MTPVLLIIFNRPDSVRTLIEALSQSKPSVVYIAADGPHRNMPGEAEKCAEARAIAQAIPWPCTVHTLFSDTNQGVDPAVEAGISWFFENETEGIILEDDCIPHPDFFTFTSEMLDRYRDDPCVMMISGNNFQNGINRGDGTYYFSHYANTWGWATWRRAWAMYDTRLTKLPDFMQQDKTTMVRPQQEIDQWLRYFTKLRRGVRSAWDGKWLFAMWVNGGMSIVPNVNLVRNIGFGADATHTAGSTFLSLGTKSFPPPYNAPSEIIANEEADRYLFETIFRVTFLQKVRYILRIVRTKARKAFMPTPTA